MHFQYFARRATTLGFALLLLMLFSVAVYAQDADGGVEPASAPGLVPFAQVQSLSAGEEGNCIVSSASALYCWGNGSNGGNGNGSNNNSSTPAAVSTLSNVISTSRGSFHSCAVVQGGSHFCWGNNGSGQFGNGTTDPSTVPVTATISGVASVSVGGSFTCARTTNGQVWCMGDNTNGQLGFGLSGGDASVPLQVIGMTTAITTAIAIDSGTFHTYALIAAGDVYCWGNNSSGQLGNDTIAASQPTAVKALLPEPVVQITAGGSTTCARTAAGKVYCWGDNASGQVGTFDNPTDHDTPIAPQSLETAIAGIDTNSSTTCAWSLAGLAYCWGSNLAGQLGGGLGDGGPSKVSVMNLPAPVRAVSVGAFHVCAILIDSQVVCWGSNQGNALGDGTNLSSIVPTFVRTPATCFQLTLARSGSGSLPVADPSNSIGCPIRHYIAGTLVSLVAIPNAQNRVNTWSSPVAFQAGGTLSMLSMPNADTTATVTYATCRQLTRAHTGNGGNPTPSFNNSAGCAAGRYAPGEVVQLAATPSSNQRVQPWSGTAIAPGLGLLVNSVVMPDVDLVVNVAYEACNALTVAAVGDGATPGVFPAASEACAAGTFVAGETIQFTAAPALGTAVAGWSGTANDSSTSLVNSLTMPNGSAAVSVIYLIVSLLPLIGGA